MMIGLQYLRQNLNMTAGELGFMIGVSKSAVSKWENNIQLISKKNMAKLTDIFKCDADILQKEINLSTKSMLKLVAQDFQTDFINKKFVEDEMFNKFLQVRNNQVVNSVLLSALSLKNGEHLLAHMLKILQAINEDTEHNFKSEKDAIAWHAMRLLS